MPDWESEFSEILREFDTPTEDEDIHTYLTKHLADAMSAVHHSDEHLNAINGVFDTLDESDSLYWYKKMHTKMGENIVEQMYSIVSEMSVLVAAITRAKVVLTEEEDTLKQAAMDYGVDSENVEEFIHMQHHGLNDMAARFYCCYTQIMASHDAMDISFAALGLKHPEDLETEAETAE